MDQSKICAKNDVNIKKEADKYLGDSALCTILGRQMVIQGTLGVNGHF